MNLSGGDRKHGSGPCAFRSVITKSDSKMKSEAERLQPPHTGGCGDMGRLDPIRGGNVKF